MVKNSQARTGHQRGMGGLSCCHTYERLFNKNQAYGTTSERENGQTAAIVQMWARMLCSACVF